ncbi:MAG TPA: metalloregulator ArsR/SmtB family transcription factor [Gaiellaceae bacterium]|nr:metalloregulator ArsR/SmtB family transcription factor [Gaiellaceae bacterium]
MNVQIQTGRTAGAAAWEGDLAAFAKALGHPARVRILRVLLARETCFCGELVQLLPLAQATVSEHLRVLKDAGLVRGEIEGPRVCYCVDREQLSRLLALVESLLEEAVKPAEGVEDGC